MTTNTAGENQSKSLEWIQPRAGARFYELRANDATMGTLGFRSAWGTLATAEFGDTAWTFKRIGFLNPRVTIRDRGSDKELAVYQPKMWGDGVVQFRDGASFDWKPVNFWRTAWAFADPKNRITVQLTPGIEHQPFWDMFKNQVTVQIDSQSVADDHLPVLLPLALYLFILQQDDAAAAVAACSASA